MRRFVLGLGVALAVLVAVVAGPVAWVELTCRGAAEPAPHDALLPPEHHRPEARTLMTYPEWHIVHAYDDYARVIAGGDPHEYDFLRAIASFWKLTCTLTEQAAALGGVDGGTRQMVYVIGASFTLELLAKAAYEETLGRLFAGLRGSARAPLDDLSAQQAAEYAAFLQQVPWYRWDFRADRAALRAAAGRSLRDRERAIALGLEYRAKAAYAGVIEQAVASVGADALRLRMIVAGLPEAALLAREGVEIIARRAEGIEIETPRYRQLTRHLAHWAGQGAEFVEIAGNDDILFTALSRSGEAEGALASFARQGSDDMRHLILVGMRDLGARLRGLEAQGMRLEHVHDY